MSSVLTTAGGPSPLPESALPKELFLRKLFDRISPRYDWFNRVSSAGLDQVWRRRAVRELNLLPGMRVLDLACGTGDLALLAALDLAPLGKVVACDLSPQMLSFAHRKLSRIPPAQWHVCLAQGRAESLPFSSGSFHAALMGFALRNVSDLERSFQELHRVLKPGGRISLLEFGRPQGTLLRMGHRFWLSTGVPVLGLLTTGAIWPFTYLRRSIQEFLPPSEVLEKLRQAGFSQTQAVVLHGGVVVVYRGVKP